MAEAGGGAPDSEIRFESVSPCGTARLAAEIYRHVECPDVVTLEGDLGTGKSVFARAFVRAAIGNADEDVPSPTFTLVQVYPVRAATAADTGGENGRSCDIWHFDLYRLAAPEDVVELDIDDAFASAVSLIEWPDRLAGRLPRDRLQVQIAYAAAGAADRRDARLIALTGHGSWRRRLAALHDAFGAGADDLVPLP